MTLKLKAYKCVFPKLFIDAYNRYMWQDDKQFEVIYGKNQKEAVKNKCKYDECFSFWELKQHIKTQRFPEMDLYDQEESLLLKGLNEKQIHQLTHSLGVTVNGICPNSFYRNYSMYYEDNSECEDLVKLGLMEKNIRLESKVYSVTEKGIEAVKTLLLITKKNPLITPR